MARYLRWALALTLGCSAGQADTFGAAGDSGRPDSTAPAAGDSGATGVDDGAARGAGELDAGADATSSCTDTGQAAVLSSAASDDCQFVLDSGCPCGAPFGYSCPLPDQEPKNVAFYVDAGIYANPTFGSFLCSPIEVCVVVGNGACGSGLNAPTTYSCPMFPDGGHARMPGTQCVSETTNNGFICCHHQ